MAWLMEEAVVMLVKLVGVWLSISARWDRIRWITLARWRLGGSLCGAQISKGSNIARLVWVGAGL